MANLTNMKKKSDMEKNLKLFRNELGKGEEHVNSFITNFNQMGWSMLKAMQICHLSESGPNCSPSNLLHSTLSIDITRSFDVSNTLLVNSSSNSTTPFHGISLPDLSLRIGNTAKRQDSYQAQVYHEISVSNLPNAPELHYTTSCNYGGYALSSSVTNSRSRKGTPMKIVTQVFAVHLTDSDTSSFGRTLIVMLLIMGGIEANPGPPMDDRASELGAPSGSDTSSDEDMHEIIVVNYAEYSKIEMNQPDFQLLLLRGKHYVRRIKLQSQSYIAGLRDGDQIVSVDGLPDVSNIDLNAMFSNFKTNQLCMKLEIMRKLKKKRKISIRKQLHNINLKYYDAKEQDIRNNRKKRYEESSSESERAYSSERYTDKKKDKKVEATKARYHRDPKPKIESAKARYHQDPQPKIEAAKAIYHQDPELKRQAAKVKYDEDPQSKIQAVKARYHEDPTPKIEAAKYRYHQDPDPKIQAAKYRYHQDPDPKIQAAKDRYHQDPDPKIQAAKDRYHKDPASNIEAVKQRYNANIEIKRAYQRMHESTKYSGNPSPQKKRVKERYEETKEQQATYNIQYREKEKEVLFKKRQIRNAIKQQMQTEEDVADQQLFDIKQESALLALDAPVKHLKQMIASKQKGVIKSRISRLEQFLQANENIPVLSDQQFENMKKSFFGKFVPGIDHVCCCCKRCFYKNQMKFVPAKKLSIMEDNLTLDIIKLLQYILNIEQDPYPFCHPCWRSLSGSKPTLPIHSVANGLLLDPIPDVLKSLNALSTQLLAFRIPFMKLLILPRGGQSGVRGGIVNVPSNAGDVLDAISLPRSIGTGELIAVKFKKRLQFKGHYFYQFISITNVQEAFLWLKANNIFYKDVKCNAEWVKQSRREDEEAAQILFKADNFEDSHISILEDLDKEDNETEENRIIEKGGNILEETFISSTLGLKTGPLDIALDEFKQIEAGIEIAPGENKTPIPLFLDKDAEYKTFPKEFPRGRFGFNTQRDKKMSYSAYFKNRLFLHDARFGQNLTYLFWAMNTLQYFQMMASINISLCKGAIKNKLGETITVRSALNEDSKRRFIVSDTGYRFMSQTRGSPPYWQKVKFDVLAMIRQLGVPTFFLTLSAADLRWPDVIGSLFCLKHGKYPTEEEIENLSWIDRATLLRENPVIAARQFQQRLKACYTQVLKSKTGPLGKVVDYFYRIEFQMRGSPHAHCLLWVDDAPILGEDSVETICKFVDRYITGQLPDGDLFPELFALVKKLQTHKHTPSCQRTSDRNGNPVDYAKYDTDGNPLPPAEVKKNKEDASCRFDIPKPVAEETSISFMLPPQDKEDSIKAISKKGTAKDRSKQRVAPKEFDPQTANATLTLKRAVEDQYINNYNIHLLQLWDANMDLQYVTNAYAALMYVLSYVTKGEKAVTEAMQRVLSELKEGEPSYQRMKKYFNAFFQHRSVSAQEAVHYISGFPYMQKSRVVKYIPTGFVGERHKMLKKPEQLASMVNQGLSNSEDVFCAGLIDKYSARPRNNPALKNLCLADFAALYDPGKNSRSEEFEFSGDSGDETDTDILESSHQVLVDENKLPATIVLNGSLEGTVMIKRKRKAVIRYHRFDRRTEEEKHSYSMCLLFLPFYSEDELSLEATNSLCFTHLFQKNENLILLNMEPYERFSKVTMDAAEMLNLDAQDAQEAAFDAAYAAASIGDNENITDDQIPSDMDVLYNYLDPEEREFDVMEGINGEDGNEDILEPNNPIHGDKPELQKTLARVVSQFNSDQKFAFDQMQKMIDSYAIAKENGVQYKEPILFISGPGGTGKSFLLDAIKTLVHLTFAESVDDITVSVLAPTGTAAVNVNGDTLHHAFSLPVQQDLKSKGMNVSSRKMEQMRSSYKNLCAILIDEISMVSSNLFELLNGRLNNIFGVKQQDSVFGNLMVICFGDFYQISPVAAPRIFKDPSMSLKTFGSIWRDNAVMVELKIIERQKGDQAYAELLNRVRTGTHKDSDIMSLSSRTLPALGLTIDDPMIANSTMVFRSNAAVNATNLNKLEQLKISGKKGLVLKASDGFDDPNQAGDLAKLMPSTIDRTGGLPESIEISTGARVMLRRNIDVSDGLVNGALGKVIGWTCTDREGKHPLVVHVEFDASSRGIVGAKARTNSKWKLSGSRDSVIPIGQTTAKFLSTNYKCYMKRTQFPFLLAFASTAHKVQGATMEKIVLDLSGFKGNAGLAYVALSRVTSINGLFLMSFDAEAISVSPAVHIEMNRLRKLSHIAPIPLPVQDKIKKPKPPKAMVQVDEVASKNAERFLVAPLEAKKIPDAVQGCARKVVMAMKSARTIAVAEIQPFLLSTLLSLGREMEGLCLAISEMEILTCRNDNWQSISEEQVQMLLYPALLDILVPVTTTGDGNCFYNSLSMSLFGTEHYHTVFRALASFGLAKHEKFFKELLQLGHWGEPPTVGEKQTNKAYNGLLEEIVKDKTWAGPFEIMAVALTLDRPISLFVSCLDHTTGVYKQWNQAENLETLRNSYRLKLPSMPSFLMYNHPILSQTRFPVPIFYGNDHFTSLVLTKPIVKEDMVLPFKFVWTGVSNMEQLPAITPLEMALFV